MAKCDAKQVDGRRAAWDDDLRRVNDELDASTLMVDMEVMRSHLEDMLFLEAFDRLSGRRFEAGRHSVCSQAQSFKPSVKARASKVKNIIISKQKQE